jgi:uncharacterized protein
MYAQTPRTTARRDRGRISYDRTAAHAVLDEAYHCVLSFTVDGELRALPTLHVRIGDTLYLHGSTGSRPLLAARGPAGLPACVAVTLLDGLVYGRAQFHHSANYRSVVAHGTARLVAVEAEKRAVLAALVDKAAPGRSADSRPPTRKELAESAVIALSLREVSVKARTGPVVDEPDDYGLPHWAGVLPLRLTAGRPEPDDGVTAPVPAYLRPKRSPWLTPTPMRGRHVVLEPLDRSHAADLFAAADDAEVWWHLGSRRPGSPAPWPRRSTSRWPHTTGASGCRGCNAAPSPVKWSARRRTTRWTRPAGPWPSVTPGSAGRGGEPGSTPKPSCCC